jgi:hypothetical protein
MVADVLERGSYDGAGAAGAGALVPSDLRDSSIVAIFS